MTELRCKDCGRFLCQIKYGEIIIKCSNSKCKAVNTIRLESYLHLLTVKPNKATI